MTEVTPGPWIIDDSHLNGAITIRRAHHVTPTPVAELWLNGSERLNARLIAAAPDMLEALKTCRDALMSRCSIHDKTADGAIGEAWAAIDKATGG